MFLADETEDEDVNKEYIEEINRDAVMIAAAKLVAGDAVPKVVNIVLLCILRMIFCNSCWYKPVGEFLAIVIIIWDVIS